MNALCFFSITLSKYSIGKECLNEQMVLKSREKYLTRKVLSTFEKLVKFLSGKESELMFLVFGYREGVNSGSGGSISDSVFEQDSTKSGRASMYVFLQDCPATLLWFGEVDFS